MAVAERRANVVWNGNLFQGSGTFDLASSEAMQGCPVSNALSGNVDIQVNASLD